MTSRRWDGAALVMVLGGAMALLLPAEASADKVSEAMAECRGKEAGDACSVAGRKGACVKRSVERGNGYDKRWVECEPGKRPKRRAPEAVIDGAGPSGVLPEAPTPAPEEAGEALGTSSAAAGDAAAAVPVPAAEPVVEAPAPASASAPATPPAAADAEREAAAPVAAEAARADADAGGACRLGGAGAPGGLLLVLLAGLRRRRARSPRA